MADEISLSVRFSCSKNGSKVELSLANPLKVTQTGNAQTKNVQSVGTSAEALDLSDVSSARFLLLRNVESSGDILIYNDAGGTQLVATLKPGDPMVMPNAASLWAKSSSGTLKLEVCAVEA